MGKEATASVAIVVSAPDFKPETWSSWFCRHGTQFAKGGVALIGLALLGGAGYWLRSSAAKSSRESRVVEVDDKGVALIESNPPAVDTGLPNSFADRSGLSAVSYAVLIGDEAVEKPETKAAPTLVVISQANAAPVIVNNKLTVQIGKTQVLTSDDLLASDIDTSASNLVFEAQGITHGTFKKFGSTVVNWTQQDVNSGAISFVHDGGTVAPTYQLRVSDGVTVTDWARAKVTLWDDFVPLTGEIPALTAGWPKSVSLSNGRLMVVGLVGPSSSSVTVTIYGKIFNADGSVYKDQFVLDTQPHGAYDNGMDIGQVDDNKVLMVYIRYTYSLGGEIDGKMYDLDGNYIQTVSNMAGDNYQYCYYGNRPKIVKGLNTSPKRYLVVWEDDYETYFRLIDQNGNLYGGAKATKVSMGLSYDYGKYPTVVNLDSSKFAVIYTDYSGTKASERRYWASDGSALDAVQVQMISGACNELSSVSLNDGRYAVIYGNGNKNYLLKVFTASRTVSRDASLITNIPNTSPYVTSHVGRLNNGGFVVVWTTATSETPATVCAIYGQLFDANANKYRSQFRVTPVDGGYHTVAGLTNGNVAVAYNVGGKVETALRLFGQDYSPTLTAYTLPVVNGLSVTLSETHFNVTDTDSNYRRATYTVSGVSRGRFERITAAGIPITSFLQNDVSDGLVRFVHDGSNVAPSFSIEVSDGALSTSPIPAIVSFNDSPTLTTNQLTITQGQTVNLSTANLNATDAEQSAAQLTFTVSSVQHGRFERVSAAGTAITTFTLQEIQNSQIRFVHDGTTTAPSYSVAVNDGSSSTTPVSATITFNRVPYVNSPIAAQTSCCTASVGNAYSFTFSSSTFVDPDGDTLTYTATKSDGTAYPAWLSFNSATRTFSGTPNDGSQIGNLALKVTATDTSSASVSDTFTLAIAKTLNATNTAAPIIYTEDVQYSFISPIVVTTPSSTVTVTLTINNPSVGALSTATSGGVTSEYNPTTGVWSASGATTAVNALLTGLKFNPYANKYDAFSIAVSITDGYGQSKTDTISVTGIPVNDAPRVTNAITTQASCCSAGIGQAYSFTFAGNTFTDLDGDTLTYTATKSDGTALPAWLSFNSATRTLSGTPTSNSDIGNLNLKVTATETSTPDHLSVSDTFTLAIAKTLFATNTHTGFSYTEDMEYTFTSPIVVTTPSATVTVTLTLSNPAAGSLSTATSGSVTSAYNPSTGVWTASGAKADVNTLLAGLKYQPVAHFHAAFSVAVSISDGYSQAITDSISATGTHVNHQPVLNSPISEQASCCAAGVGQSYNFAFAANTFTDPDGDALTYTATKADGTALPAWLSFNSATRTLSGTPTSNSDIGNLNLKVTATETSTPDHFSVSGTFTLQVAKTLSATNLASTINYVENTDYNLADIVVTTPSTTITARLTLSDTTAGSLTTATSGSVTSTYNAGTGVWQASGNTADVNALLAGLKYRPATGYQGEFSIAVSITDSYGQSLSSTLTAPALVPPTLVASGFRVPLGGNVILTTDMLSATDSSATASSLVFTVANVLHGRFELVGNIGVSITSFTKQQIANGQVKLIHDGTSTPVSFDVKVKNDRISTAFTGVTTRINHGPILVKGALTIGKGETVVVTVDVLNANDPDVEDTPDQLTFGIANLVNGRFELTTSPGVPVTSFTLRQIINRQVKLVQAGSGAPTFDVTVSDGQITTVPVAFSATLKNSDDSILSYLIGAGGGTGAVVFALLCFFRKRVQVYLQRTCCIPKNHEICCLLSSSLHLGITEFDGGDGKKLADIVNDLTQDLFTTYSIQTKYATYEELQMVANAFTKAIRKHSTVQPKKGCSAVFCVNVLDYQDIDSKRAIIVQDAAAECSRMTTGGIPLRNVSSSVAPVNPAIPITASPSSVTPTP